MTALQKRKFAILKSLGMIEKILMQSAVYSLEAAFQICIAFGLVSPKGFEKTFYYTSYKNASLNYQKQQWPTE